MSRKNRITESNPRTGALPSEQTAKKSGRGGANRDGMFGMNKLIYELVQDCVSVCDGQFNGNLKFNSEVLTNTLYDNLYDLVGDKIQEDDFVNWIVDELTKRGCVIKSQDLVPEKTSEKEPVEVVQVDTSSHEDLKQNVYAIIELIKSQKLIIFKLFSDIDNTFKTLEQARQTNDKDFDEESKDVQTKIDTIVPKIKNGSSKKDEQTDEAKVESKPILDQSKDQIDQQITAIENNLVDVQDKYKYQTKITTKVYDNVKKYISNVGTVVDKQTEYIESIKTDKKKLNVNTKLVNKPKTTGVISSKDNNKVVYNKDGFRVVKVGKMYGLLSSDGKTITTGYQLKDGTKHIYDEKGNLIHVDKNGKLIDDKKNSLIRKNKLFFSKKKKPGLLKRGMLKLGNKIRNSKVGRFVGKISSGIKKAWGAVKKVYGAIKKTVKVVAKGAFKVAKGFVKASRFVGKAVVKGGVSAVKGTKKLIKKMSTKAGRKNVLKAIRYFTPAKIVTKLAWRAIKFVGKKIWNGIKKLALKMLKVLGGVFSLGKKFANKIGWYIGKLGGKVKDKAYKFLVRPIAGIMVTVMGFCMGIAKSPVDFMKWLVPSIFDRILDCLSGIKQAMGKLLKSTWGVFKKILFNPLTITLLIGALFYFFWPHISGMLSGGLEGFKQNIWPKITSIARSIGSFLKGAWEIIQTVGGFIFSAIDWLTDPEGWLATAIRTVFNVIRAIKKGIRWLIGKSGKDNLKSFCLFLSGDTIGLALAGIAGAVKKFWKWFKNTKFMRVIINIFDAVSGYFKMWAKIFTNIWDAIKSFDVWHPIDSFGRIKDGIANSIDAVCEWVDKVKKIWSDDYNNNEVLVEDPQLENKAKSSRTNIAIRSLKMTGMNGGKVLGEMDKIAQLQGWQGDKSIMDRLDSINSLYQQNSDQVEEYRNFITQAWELGKGNPEMSGRATKQLLESPELSMRLMSVFYYYNPQTGQVQSLFPQSYIGQFLDNIRKMVSEESRDDAEVFKTLIMAFEQANMERSDIVNKQSDIINDFAEKISKFDLNSKNAKGELSLMTQKLRNNTLFNDIDYSAQFSQISSGYAKSRDLDSVTGSTMGTNKLFKFKPVKDADGNNVVHAQSEFDVPPPEKPDKKNTREQFGNLILTKGMENPAPSAVDVGDEAGGDIYEKWLAHQRARNEALSKMSDKEATAAGFKDYTLDEFKALQQNAKPPKSPEEIKKEKEKKAKRLATLRLERDIAAYHNQGKTANSEQANIGKVPSILKVETDNITQRLIMFSPEWQKVQGTSKISDDELLLYLDSKDTEARERIRKAKEAEEQKKQEEARRKKREQEILDYSAKVNGGFIEVKIGEDVTAMEEAWIAHQRKRNEALSKMSSAEADARGLKDYTWEEWKRYYRKMHGLPEDGIKRIPFEGKRKERVLKTGPRSAFSPEEMAKYGIEVSKDGPVMIPLDKAMKAAGSILDAANTIYSVRDGLEIMKQGLDGETQKLKKQREGGMPVAVVSNPPNTNSTTQPAVTQEQNNT